MTWQGKRRSQLPRDWARIRQARLELDGERCTWVLEPDEYMTAWNQPDPIASPGDRCPVKATDVHHAGRPDDHRIEALRSLCAHHHKVETQREAQQAQGRGASRFRPRRPHPGLKEGHS